MIIYTFEGTQNIFRQLYLSREKIKNVYLLGLGEVKQTVNTPIVIDRLVNKANVRKPLPRAFVLKIKHNKK